MFANVCEGPKHGEKPDERQAVSESVAQLREQFAACRGGWDGIIWVSKGSGVRPFHVDGVAKPLTVKINVTEILAFMTCCTRKVERGCEESRFLCVLVSLRCLFIRHG